MIALQRCSGAAGRHEAPSSRCNVRPTRRRRRAGCMPTVGACRGEK